LNCSDESNSGVGASCIYPLLGCASRPNWSFGGVEIDGVNYDSANRNVKLNGLEQRIEICKNDSESPLINMDGLGLQKADFVMCNPPFFTSREDMKATFTNKDNPPSAVCTGADIEMIAEGGDLGFVLRIFEESEKLKHRVSWYSSMFGKLSSANAMISVLKEKSILNYAVTCLQAGNVTKRWAVAWSFGDLRPEEVGSEATHVLSPLSLTGHPVYRSWERCCEESLAFPVHILCLNGELLER